MKKPLYLKSVRCVIFDMDGVIIDSMPDHYRAWKKVFSDNGVKMTRKDVYLREGQKGVESIQEIFAQAHKEVSASAALKIIATKEKLFKKITRHKYIPGSRAFIRKLHKYGLILGLVTGTSRHEMEHSLPRDLRDLFTVTITGNDVKKGKPDPEPYQKALKALGCEPAKALVIENAPFGILSAKSAGAFCFAIQTSLPAAYLKKADHVFKGFRQLNACADKYLLRYRS